MKMAAAEALYETEDGAGLSVFAIGPWEKTPDRVGFNIEIPGLLSFLATNSFNGQVEGIDEVQAQSVAEFGPGEYRPIIGLTYWSFRGMIGAGLLMLVIALWGLWKWGRGALVGSRWFSRAAMLGIALPFIANSAGWIFTEVGRQPWVVYGLLRTDNAASPSVSTAEVLTTLIGFTLLYAVLAVIAGWIFVRAARRGPEPAADAVDSDDDSLRMTMAY
jgi:cytochrome d ubiquinol oxidase subunit I